MFSFICNIFCKEKKEDVYDPTDLETKVRDIRRRIEEQRAKLAYRETQSSFAYTTEPVLEKTPIVDTAREKKNAELNDIKAKLLGKKK